jgi:hypothetical protein
VLAAVLVLATLAVLIVWAVFVVPFAHARWKAREWERQRRRAPATELAAEAATWIRMLGWDRFASGAALLQRQVGTDAELLAALERLWQVLAEEDDAHGRLGPGSNSFNFHDCGLSWFCEMLRERSSALAGPD